jgi:hypothetical protein
MTGRTKKLSTLYSNTTKAGKTQQDISIKWT